MKPYEIVGECIEWVRGKTKDGYGQKYLNGKVLYTHRLAWENKFGPIQNGLCVLHKCDNRSCYNVDHLFLGTRKDNMIDKTIKGRGFNPSQKLNSEIVREIRQRIKDGEKCSILANEFNVTASNIRHIKKRDIWPNV